MTRRLLGDGAHSVWSDPSGHVMLAEMQYSVGWTGRSVAGIEELTGVRVAYLTRYGDARLVTGTTALQDGDLLHVLLDRADLERVAELLAADPLPEGGHQ
jgi:trk system potassium uptake protein TrkA